MGLVRIYAAVLLVFFIFVTFGCAFLKGLSYAETPEYKEKMDKISAKLVEAQSALLDTKARAERLVEALKSAKEKGVGLEIVTLLKNEGLAAKESVERLISSIGDIKGEAEELIEIGKKQIEGQGTWAQIGLGVSTLLNIGLTVFGGNKAGFAAKALLGLHAVMEGVDALDLNEKQKDVLMQKQSGKNIGDFVEDELIKLREKKAKKKVA